MLRVERTHLTGRLYRNDPERRIKEEVSPASATRVWEGTVSMAEQRVQRRLAAILATDVVG